MFDPDDARGWFGDEVVQSWDEMLSAFEERLTPIAERHGFNPNAVLVAMVVNKVYNVLAAISPDSDEEPWKT